MAKILVWLKRPQKPAVRCYVSDNLKSVQKLVGGYVEMVKLSNSVCVLCDEDGQMKKLPYNTSLMGVDFVGTLVLATFKNGEFGSCGFNGETLAKFFPGMVKDGVVE